VCILFFSTVGVPPAPLRSDLNLLASKFVPPNHFPRTLSTLLVIPSPHSPPDPGLNVQRSLDFHRLSLVGCADFSLSRPTRCHNLRKWVRYFRADHSGPFEFWSLQDVRAPKALRRNSKRAGQRGDTVAERDVRSGYSHGSPFIN